MSGERRTALIYERLRAVGHKILESAQGSEGLLQDSRLERNRVSNHGRQFECVCRPTVTAEVAFSDGFHDLPQSLEVKSEGFDLGGNVHRITVSVAFLI